MAAWPPESPLPHPRRALTRDQWIVDFVNTLIAGPRPDMPRRLGNTIAGTEYREGLDPVKAARAWAERNPGAR